MNSANDNEHRDGGPTGDRDSPLQKLQDLCQPVVDGIRRLAGFVKRRLMRGGLVSLAVLQPSALILSWLLTITFFVLTNNRLCRLADTAYEEFRAPALAGAVDVNQSLRSANTLVPGSDLLASEDGRKWFRAFWSEHGDKPAHRQIVLLIREAASSSQDGAREEILRDQVTGRRRLNRIWMLVRTETTSGDAVFDAQVEFDGGILSEALEADPIGPGKQELIAALCSELVEAVHPHLRGIQRINGLIQWAIIFLSFLLLVLMVRRHFLLAAFVSDWRAGRYFKPTAANGLESSIAHVVQHMEALAESETSEFERTRVAQEEVNSFRMNVDGAIYSNLRYLVTMMPTLGFIGTVLGMGEALVQADRLLTSIDQQQAIKSMTQQLGFAFDTTLVGLVSALMVGLCLSGLRCREWRIYENCERDLRQKFVTAGSESPSHSGGADE